MVPEHVVRIYFQWHVPEAAAAVRPPPQPRPEGQRRRRERPPPVALPAPVAPSWRSGSMCSARRPRETRPSPHHPDR